VALVQIDPADEVGERQLLWFLQRGNGMEAADAARALWTAGRHRSEVEAALRRLLVLRPAAHEVAPVLGAIGPDAAWAVPRLIALLCDREMRDGHQIGWGSHMDVARALGRMGPSAKAALPSLQSAMVDHHRRVRPVAALAAYRIGGDPVAIIRALVAVIDAEPGPGDWAPRDAVRALAEIATTNAAAGKVLEEMKSHPRVAVRLAVREALGVTR